MEKPVHRGPNIKGEGPAASPCCTGREELQDLGAALGAGVVSWVPKPRHHFRSEKSQG